MNIIIVGKNVEVNEALREYVEKRVNKLDRYLPTLDEIRVHLRKEEAKDARDRQVAEITLKSNGTILRSEERSADLFTSVDAAVDKLSRQVRRYKERRHKRGREVDESPPLPEPVEEPRRIVRTKRFLMQPLDEEEAIEQMELLGHDFFLFYSVNTGLTNLLYRRRDGNYGLIEAELA